MNNYRLHIGVNNSFPPSTSLAKNHASNELKFFARDPRRANDERGIVDTIGVVGRANKAPVDAYSNGVA